MARRETGQSGIPLRDSRRRRTTALDSREATSTAGRDCWKEEAPESSADHKVASPEREEQPRGAPERRLQDEEQRERAVRLAVAAAQASLFGAPTPERVRTRRELENFSSTSARPLVPAVRPVPPHTLELQGEQPAEQQEQEQQRGQRQYPSPSVSAEPHRDARGGASSAESEDSRQVLCSNGSTSSSNKHSSGTGRADSSERKTRAPNRPSSMMSSSEEQKDNSSSAPTAAEPTPRNHPSSTGSTPAAVSRSDTGSLSSPATPPPATPSAETPQPLVFMAFSQPNSTPAAAPPSRRERDLTICEVVNLHYNVDIPRPSAPAAVSGESGSKPAWSPMMWCFPARRRKAAMEGGGDWVSQQRRALLRGVSCRVCAGEMVAVIGASGAGKSTFLDLLAGRKMDGECAGEILLKEGNGNGNGNGNSNGNGNGTDESSRNEEAARKRKGGRASVYVTQDDFHVAELTVRESLAFAVRLGMGGRQNGVREEDRDARVEDLLNVLGLQSCADVPVGNPLERGISGGQARRLSVGVGVADLESVRLLLLDEPTTGLDSTSATEVLQLARRLATKADRRAVVASVHQPSAEMFVLFDKVLVLVDGRQAFFGSTSDAARILSRPEIGVVPSPGQNPAEFILLAAKAAPLQPSSLLLARRQERSGTRSTSTSQESAEPSSPKSRMERESAGFGNVDYLYDEESKHSEAEVVGKGAGGRHGRWRDRERELTEEEGNDGGGFTRELRRVWLGHRTPYAVGFWSQVSALWSRAWMVQFRRTDSLWALFAKNTLVGVLTATVFWQEGAVATDEALVDPLLGEVTPAASNILGVLYFGCLYGLTGHLQAIPEMFEWKRHFERERAAGMYSTGAYWLVSSTVHLPVIFAGFLVYLNVCYWALGLPAVVSKFFIFASTSLLSTLLGYSMAQTLSAALGSPQSAFATWPLLFVTAANFAGFTVRLPAVRIWFRWLCELSFCRWLFQMVVVNEFEDFDQGSQLLDLYFGTDRLSLLANAAVIGVFYMGSLLLALVFLQPRRSRLRILAETPASYAVVGESEAAVPGQEERASEGRTGGIWTEGGGGIWEGEGEGEGRRGWRKNPRDVVLVEGGDSDGPLYYLEEGRAETPAVTSSSSGRGVDTGVTDATLETPLLEESDSGRVEGFSGAGVRDGSRVAFLDLHYHVYLRGNAGNKKSDNSSTTSHIEGEAGQGKEGEAHVLRGVTGVVSPGQMMAILGPSGSGKTTLLDLLGGRKTGSVGRQEGHIIVDGVRGRDGGTGSRSPAGSAYVMQDNVHHSALTVRQTLDFAAKLRMPSTATAEARNKRVKSMVAMLGLAGVLDTTVGDESKRGISGGEAKRLSIAVEAMDLPGFLILDEPTSGLDATTALEVLTAVRGLADLGRTVAISLHQPSAEMFALFDTCLLLTRGGSMAYCGKADRAMAFFSSIGLAPHPSSDSSPADFLLSVASSVGIGTGLGPRAPLAAEAAGESDQPASSAFSVGIALPMDGTTMVGANDTGGRPFGEDQSLAREHDDGAQARPETLSTSASEGGLEIDFGIGHVGVDVSDPTDVSIPRNPAMDTRDVADSGDGGDAAEHGRASVLSKPATAMELERAFMNSPEAAEVRELALRDAEEGGEGRGDAGSDGRRTRSGRKRRRSMLWLSAVLTQRELTTTWQDKARIATAVARHAFVGSFYGTLWWRLGVGRVYERVGVVFFSLVFVMLGNQQNIPRIFQDRLLFYREKGAGVYGSVEYWWSIVIAQVPLAVLTTTVYGGLVYFMAGLNDNGWEPFGYFLLVIVLCNLVALSFCQMLAAATRLQDTAVALFPVALFFFIAFGGFIVRLPTLPEYLRSWAPIVSFVRWAMEGLVINEFEGNEDKIFAPPEGIPVTPDEMYDLFLEAYGFGEAEGNGEVLIRVLWILVGNLVLFRLLTLVCLTYITFERR